MADRAEDYIEMRHRWEQDARDLIQSLQFKPMTETEMKLWDALRMALLELDTYRDDEVKDADIFYGLDDY